MTLPVVDTQMSSGIDTVFGSDILQIGWMGILVYQFGWFANLVLVPGLLLATGWPNQAPKVNIAIAIILLILCVNTALWTSIPADNGENQIIAHRLGYWLWMISVVASAAWLLICTFVCATSPDTTDLASRE